MFNHPKNLNSEPRKENKSLSGECPSTNEQDNKKKALTALAGRAFFIPQNYSHSTCARKGS